MTNKTSTTGYWQVLDEKGKVIAQRAGSPLSEDYMRNYVWDIPSDYQLVFVESSDYAQPNKFFNAHKNDSRVVIYDELVSESEHTAVVTGRCALSDLQPHLQVAIQSFEMPVEDVDAFFQNHDEVNVWSAFIGDKWAGTSEY